MLSFNVEFFFVDVQTCMHSLTRTQSLFWGAACGCRSGKTRITQGSPLGQSLFHLFNPRLMSGSMLIWGSQVIHSFLKHSETRSLGNSPPRCPPWPPHVQGGETGQMSQIKRSDWPSLTVGKKSYTSFQIVYPIISSPIDSDANLNHYPIMILSVSQFPIVSNRCPAKAACLTSAKLSCSGAERSGTTSAWAWGDV